MSHSIKMLSALVGLTCALPASASPREDLAYNAQESAGNKTSGWVVEKLMTFEVGAKCYAKIADKKSGAFTKITSEATYIQRLAAEMTKEEWSSIENQSANSKEANRAIVENKIEEFKPTFHITIKAEGDDCDAGGNALWLKYATHTILAVVKYPPKSGKLTVLVNTTSKVKAVTAEANKDGTAFTVTGPIDVEPHMNWGDVVDSALKRISTKN